MLTDQAIVNWILTAIGALLGFLLNSVWRAVRDLQVADKDIAEKVSGIEVLVAGSYAKRDEVERVYQTLFDKLDRIETKLDRKVDK